MLRELKATTSIGELARLLGYEPSALSYIAYWLPDQVKYTEFDVPKKNGTQRRIKAPNPRLKRVQRNVAAVLGECYEELLVQKLSEGLKPIAFGFRKGGSIVDHAHRHRNKRHILTFDIDNFFPSINFGRVRGFFLKNRDFELDPAVATVLAKIACHENELPQGSPCSPVIANLVAGILDSYLVALAKRYRCSYSRYADDLTFSTNLRKFPSQIAFFDDADPATVKLGARVITAVERSGFTINDEKTRLVDRFSRQTVTGLVVNQRPNIKSEYYQLARAMCHSLFQKGEFSFPGDLSPISAIDEGGGDTQTPPNLQRLEGVLNHINFVKNFEQLETIRRERKKEKTAGDEKKKKIHLAKTKLEGTAVHRLYKQFLFFRLYGTTEKPVILTEGKTDIAYLKLALKNLSADYPSLIQRDGSKTTFGAHFQKHSGQVSETLSLNGGVDNFKVLINTYLEKATKYKAWRPSSPVIIVTDSDKAVDGVFKAATAHSTGAISRESTESFMHIVENLYIVKTPMPAGYNEAAIEDLFSQRLLTMELEGRRFSYGSTSAGVPGYEKDEFSKRVVAKQATADDFDGFRKLLDGIAAAIKHFSEPS